MELILDIGSGNTLPDFKTGRRLIDEVVKRDTKKHRIVFKTQLFKSAPPNKPLEWDAFDKLFHYAKEQGYDLTSSVFDLGSLSFLLSYGPVFVKIACRPDLYHLIGEVPRKVPVYVSMKCGEYGTLPGYDWENTTVLDCVSKYPAEIDDYLAGDLAFVSDHTRGWALLHSAQREDTPVIWEKHLCLERSPDNPDSGPFAVTPEDLEGIV